jgi:uncharacterized protein (DUF488 family)
MTNLLYTVGHSNHPIDKFIELLKKNGITAVGDVRSHPFSRHFPQFSQAALKRYLKQNGIAYTFLGNEFGARSGNSSCYKNGKVQYDRLAALPVFANGVKRVLEGMKRYNIAFMCAEKDPLSCHRALLVSRHFFRNGIPVGHILADASLESHEQLESRLLKACRLPEGDLLKSRAEYLSEAYLIQGERVAYQDQSMNQQEAILG